MARKRGSKRKTRSLRKSSSIGKGTLFILLVVTGLSILLILSAGFRNNVFTSLIQIFAARPGSGGGYDVTGGCASNTTRPCYDKLTTSSVNLLGKNGINTYTACSTNAAPNKVGEVMHKTSICGQEIVSYCHDGKSNNFIRKFNGECSTEPSPPPQPSPEPTFTPAPTPTPGAVSIPFRIIYPNGGEQLAFGSHQVVRWEGGDTVNDWPVFLSIIDKDRNVAIREMVIGIPNDGQEDWIVDLPLGNYYAYYGQGCRFSTCASASEWDYSDAKFSVVAGLPVEKVNSDYPLNQSLVVLSPSGGEVWPVGLTQTIKWSGLTSGSTINLYLVDDKQSYVSIATGSINDGSHQWTVPGFIPPGQYKIYVSCNNCGTAPTGFTGGLYNYSFYPFTIK